MILSINNVEVTFRVGPRFNRQPILGVAGVSFDVAPGETFALVGESGSGKTTLANVINGLQSVSKGDVTFLGQRIDTASPRDMKPLRQQMVMMFQDPVGSLSPRMKVGDLVAEPFHIHKIKANITDETERLLSLVGLSGDFANRYPHQLSGGQMLNCRKDNLQLERTYPFCRHTSSKHNRIIHKGVANDAQIINSH